MRVLRHILVVSLAPLFGALVAIAVLSVAAAAAATPSIDAERSLAEQRKAQPRPPKPAKGPTPLLSGTGVIRWGTLYARGSGYERYAYVLVSRPDARKAARLPGTTLVYKSGTSIQQGWSTGVTHDEARANDWLLKDAAGAHVMNVQYGAFVADIGNPAYQRRFLENTIRFLKRTKVDGIFLDDVLGDPRSMARTYPAKYPTTEAWEGAMVSFVHVVGTGLKARGYYVLANAAKFVSDDPRSDTGAHVAEFWNRLAPGVSGLMTEFWVQSPSDHGQLRVHGPNWDQNWPGWQSLVSIAQARGVDFFGLTYGAATNTRAMRYARGSFLLDWNGRGGAFLYQKNDDANPYHPKWVLQLGRPLQPKAQTAPGIWQRRYERGMVVVNATSSPGEVLVFGTKYTLRGADAIFVRAPRR